MAEMALEALVSTLEGWPRIQQLLYIAEHAPALRQTAAKQAIQAIQACTSAVALYAHAWKLYNTDAADPIAFDEAWKEAVEARTAQDRTKLYGELRMYQNNTIDESIRMAYHDLGRHYWHTGEMEEALLHFEKARDYFSTNEHALEMYLSAMEVALYLGQYATAVAYADKAESVVQTLPTIDFVVPGQTDAWRSVLAQGSTDPSARGEPTTGSAAISALFRAGGGAGLRRVDVDERSGDAHEKVLPRINAVRMLGEWGDASVHERLPTVRLDAVHASAYADMANPIQFAWYAVLSALHVPPNEQRQRVSELAEDAQFRCATESDQAPREVLQAFLVSNFSRTLAILARYTDAFALDRILGKERTEKIMHAIMSRLLVCYLNAFSRCSLQGIATAFGWALEDTVQRVALLIRAGNLAARIDWHAQVVEMDESYATSQGPDTLWKNVCNAMALRQRTTLAQKMSAANVIVRR
ncbi:hypothetical protein MVES_003547 [Malassezia vespertilionis]|uniref:26S proteasome regulatory subunit Rpn7 N-terminal domain-containing protein n=1 Tax=Malassezia vespertilionis TaxID=2020962 RepID=A0A2N1J846_9BASI|nr:hypothetical protein MVES_003547 [Malassezia vespertilionis]